MSDEDGYNYGLGNEGDDGEDNLENDVVDVTDENPPELFSLDLENKEDDSDEESDEEEANDDSKEEEEEDLSAKIDPRVVLDHERITSPILNIYEMTRMIAVRTAQIEKGSPVVPPVTEMIHLVHAVDIAKEELKQRVIPIKLKRTRPDGKIEYWSIQELQIIRQ